MDNSLKIMKLWDRIYLSHKWVIGDTLTLIRRSNVSTIDEWREYYYRSGEIRGGKINRHPNKHILNKLDITENEIVFKQLSNDIKNFNFFHGRTLSEVGNITSIFEDKLLEKKIEFEHQEVVNLIDTLIFGRSWGIYEIELNVIKKLKDGFTSFDFIPSRIKILNEKSKVSYEIYENKQLVCGLDIINSNYFKIDSDEFIEFRANLILKHLAYEKKYNRKSYVILTNNNGTRFSKKIKLIEYFNEDGRIKNKNAIFELLKSVK